MIGSNQFVDGGLLSLHSLRAYFGETYLRIIGAGRKINRRINFRPTILSVFDDRSLNIWVDNPSTPSF